MRQPLLLYLLSIIYLLPIMDIEYLPLIIKFNLSFYLNLIRLIFLARLIVIFNCILKFSQLYIYNSPNKVYFYTTIYLFLISIILLLISRSFIILCVSWEGLGITSYFLVQYYYTWNRLQGSNLTFWINRLGDSFILIIFIYWDISSLFLLLRVIIIRITKRAIFPFSSWLPAAIAAPTPVSSLVHSRTLVTAGLYLLFRFNIPLFNIYFNSIMFILGLITMLGGSLRAIYSVDFKKLVAFSTLRQLGFIIVLFSTLWRGLFIFHLLVHAFLKRILFILVGIMMTSCYRQNIKDFYVKQIVVYKTITYMLIINFFSLIGTSIFVCKEFIITNLLSWRAVFNKIFFICIMLTLFYSIRIIYIINNTVLSKVKSNTIFNIKKELYYYFIVFLIISMLWWYNIINYNNQEYFDKLIYSFICLLYLIKHFTFNLWKIIRLINNKIISMYKLIVILLVEELFINNLFYSVFYSFKFIFIINNLLITTLIVIIII